MFLITKTVFVVLLVFVLLVIVGIIFAVRNRKKVSAALNKADAVSDAVRDGFKEAGEQLKK
jgi:uncharacterized integral membrane protein